MLTFIHQLNLIVKCIFYALSSRIQNLLQQRSQHYCPAKITVASDKACYPPMKRAGLHRLVTVNGHQTSMPVATDAILTDCCYLVSAAKPDI